MDTLIHFNNSAGDWTFGSSDLSSSDILTFHQRFPQYGETPLHSLPAVATELGVGHVLVKDESDRFGLPSFKALGASWALYRAVADRVGLPADTSISLEDLGAKAREQNITLLTTTEGNWGRASARTMKYMGMPAKIFVPTFMPETTRAKLRSEGADVHVVDGSYDECIEVIKREASADGNMLLAVDVGWEGYTDIPQWVVEGYSTMLEESDHQVLSATGGKPATHAFVPVGAGSIAQAVTQHFKSKDKTTPTGQPRVITVEPDTAAGLKTSMAAGHIVPVPTQDSIMCGLNCGTVSSTAWPILKAGVDTCVLITDNESHKAVMELEGHGIKAGPCGAAPLAALRRLCHDAKDQARLDQDSVVVLCCTEGQREYEVPST